MLKKTLDMSKFQKLTDVNDETLQLIFAFSGIQRPIDMRNFLFDLLTDKELRTMARRLEAARRLADGEAYGEVCHGLGMSSRILTKIHRTTLSGRFGYPAALKQLGYRARMARPYGYKKP